MNQVILPNMIDVHSSNIISVGYKQDQKELYIRFNTGVYVYYNVSEALYENLIKAESKGRFLFESVRGKYSYNKIL